jgi:hypothetical protein
MQIKQAPSLLSPANLNYEEFGRCLSSEILAGTRARRISDHLFVFFCNYCVLVKGKGKVIPVLN